MKKNNSGFMLAETLLVTTFVAGTLIYLYIQFMTLNRNYSDSYKYNTVEGLYALSDVADFIKSDATALEYISSNINNLKYIDITNCSLFEERDICEKLLSIENISEIFITTDIVPKSSITGYSNSFMKFIKKINPSGVEPYRIVASFNNKTYATVRFGE